MNNNYIALRKLRLFALLFLATSSTTSLHCWATEETTQSTAVPHTTPAKYCPFDDEKVIHKQMFAENDLVMSLVDIKPMQEGHILVIPKRHVTYYHDITDAEEIAISEQIQRIYKALRLSKGPLHYILLNKNGKLAGQSIPHVHVHFIPIFTNEDESSTLSESNAFIDTMHSLNLYFWSFMSTYLPRLSDKALATKVQEMKDAMAKLDEAENKKAPEHSGSFTE